MWCFSFCEKDSACINSESLINSPMCYYLKLRAIKEVVTGTMASLTESFTMFTMSTISDSERNAITKSYDRDAKRKNYGKKLRSVFRLYPATKHKAFTLASVKKGLETLPINHWICIIMLLKNNSFTFKLKCVNKHISCCRKENNLFVFILVTEKIALKKNVMTKR